MNRANIERGIFQSAPILGDWRDYIVSFSYAENGAIVLVAGWDCEIWLYPDGTYFSSINPKIYQGIKKIKHEGRHNVYSDGCYRHPHCETCPQPDCIAKDGELNSRINQHLSNTGG